MTKSAEGLVAKTKIHGNGIKLFIYLMSYHERKSACVRVSNNLSS